MFCTNCGKENEPNAAFCTGCGQSLQANVSAPSVQSSIYAGFWKRLAAYLIDGVLLGVVVGVPCYVLTMIIIVASAATSHMSEVDAMGYQMNQYNDAAQSATALHMFGGMMIAVLVCGTIGIIANWLYFALMESSSKQATLGKMALGIKVTDLDGNRISFGRASGRYFGKILSGMIMYIGFIMAAFTEKRQGLHDMIAKTLVVNK